MNMNDAFVGSLIFNKNDGIPSGEPSLASMNISSNNYKITDIDYTMEVEQYDSQ